MLMRLLLLLIICCSVGTVRASHVMGGEITWRCNGNGYVFELVFYRDCNGAEVNIVSENIRVWHHPTVSNIPVAFISREDISPTCNPVTGSPPALDCGTGASAGNGTGAIEKITYRSAVINLAGTPPPGTGWIFTYENFSRSTDITNLVNPSTYGITIAARMYAIPGGTPGACMDNSPRFLQDPYLVSCSGEDYAYNMHAVDIDLDSLNISFGSPLDHFPTGDFNPPINPIPVPYETGFSASSPTPDASIQPGNIAAQLDPLSGELTFRSFTIGSYVVKIVARSYRDGVLIAEVEREMQLVVLNCSGANTAPAITPPFAGTFETTIDAGTLVTFNLQSTDVELLQDGSPQSNILTTTGLMYGAPITGATGCAIAPCATLDQLPPVTGIQGANVQFNWQTDCDHLVTPYGDVADLIPYYFVFKVQDNFCQVPKVTYRTVTINVRNPGIIPATQINCISTDAAGDITVSWDAVADPNGTFIEYELHTVQGGLVGTYPIGTTSATVPGVGGPLDFFVNVISGCNGNATTTSDTVRNVYLAILNANNGIANLQWNTPAADPLPGMDPTMIIQREYPAGTWTTIATLPYHTTHYLDTIRICEAFLNYRVIYSTPTCNFTSNIAGDTFEDMFTPDIPTITSVSIDTLTGNVVITWNQNGQSDTYGYVIYQKDEFGNVIPIDTVWGITNTTYIHDVNVDGPLTYTVAAFDSCLTDAIPQGYQTSAKADINTSVYLTHTIDVCNNTAVLSWTGYHGWTTNLSGYTVFMKVNGGPWMTVGSAADPEFEIGLVPLSTYCFAIRANNGATGAQAFSNLDCFTVNGPQPPDIHYLRVATVENNQVVLRHEITTGTNVMAIRFEKYNPRNSEFEAIATLPAVSGTLTHIDGNVDVNQYSYRYRAVVIDSCGREGAISNEAHTILLHVATDQTTLVNYVNWSEYAEFDGGVLMYHLYRGIDGNFDATPLASFTTDHRFYEDDVSDFGQLSGQFCYVVMAEEGPNQYGFTEESFSNIACTAITPLVYIPNAFTPGGLNPIFLPVVSFADVNSYEMTIFDRWGQPIFVTTDLSQGWDGNHQATGKLVEFGLYSYKLTILDGNQQELIYRGHVTVIR